MSFLILPNQLFEVKHLDKSLEHIIYEHPHYFKSYKYNKKKINFTQGVYEILS